MMADPLLAQSAVDRLASTAHELIIEASPTGKAKDHQSATTPPHQIDSENGETP